MLRTRWFRALLLLACLAGLLYTLTSLYLPSSRRLIFGVDKRSGRVRVVDSRVTFLPPHEYYRLSFDRRNGYAQRDGLIRVESRDQVPVTVNYRLRFRIATGDRISDAKTLVNDGWSVWVGRRVAEAVDAVAHHVPVEELLAPNSRFNQQRDPLRRTVAAYLAKSGLNVTGFEITRLEADREALLRTKRAELRRSARGAAGRVAIFAIDGADWDLPSAPAKPFPPDQWSRYAFYNNLGIQLRKQSRIKEAADAFSQAIRINPLRPTPYLNLAMALIDRQQYTAADDAFTHAVANGLPNAERWFVDYAALYRERNMPARAIALLYKGKEIFPQSYEIAANLGSALAASERYAEGLPELERALDLQPTSTLALNNLGVLYAKKNDYARALDFWNRSLAIDPRQPQIRAAAEAARSRV